MGQMEPRCTQFMRSATLDTKNSAAFDAGAGGKGAPPYGAGRGLAVAAAAVEEEE
jgi:hypothetical protein